MYEVKNQQQNRLTARSFAGFARGCERPSSGDDRKDERRRGERERAGQGQVESRSNEQPGRGQGKLAGREARPVTRTPLPAALQHGPTARPPPPNSCPRGARSLPWLVRSSDWGREKSEGRRKLRGETVTATIGWGADWKFSPPSRLRVPVVVDAAQRVTQSQKSGKGA